MKPMILLILAVLTGAAHAELTADCDSTCKRQIFSIESEYFPLHAFNLETRREAISYVAGVAVKSKYVNVKMRALEALNSNVASINPLTRALTLHSIKSIAAGSNDFTVESKAVEMIGQSLRSLNPEIAVLAADLILQIGTQSEESLTKAVAENAVNRSSVAEHLQKMKVMLANQPN